jgi:hypothetical protein
MELSNLRRWLLGLLIECPIGNALAQCPAYNYRNLPVSKLIDIVESMHEEDLISIIEQHKKCIKQREAVNQF